MFREFVRRAILGHAVVVLGIVLDTAGLFIFLRYADASLTEVMPWYLALATATLAVGGYLTWSEERARRGELEARVTVKAWMGSYAANIPDPGPDRTSMRVKVFWEIWCTEDAVTDQIGLNIIYLYERPWWKFWRKTRFPIEGIPPTHTGTTEYRNKLSPVMNIPFNDSAEFEYLTTNDAEGDPHWLLEFVLVMGLPRMTYRIPITLPTRDELARRGINPPL